MHLSGNNPLMQFVIRVVKKFHVCYRAMSSALVWNLDYCDPV